MKRYTVTVTIDGAEEFVRFVDAIGPAAERMLVSMVESADEHQETPFREAAPKASRKPAGAPRKQRVSKVNNKILETLNGGQATVKEMKAALEQAGFAPGSLSTALANLQRDGTVVRVEEGVYQLAQAA